MSTLIVKLTSGAAEAERVSQAFTVAATGVAAGADVSVWLTGDAVSFAQPGAAEAFSLPESAPLADLLEAILDAGTLTVCVQCARRRGLTASDFLPGVRIAGAATFVEECLAEDSQALVY